MGRRFALRQGRRWPTFPAASGATFPTDLTNIIARFNPSNVASVTSAANLASQVNNLQGTAGPLVQATAGNKPAYGLTTQNGLNMLDCTLNRFMVSTLAAGLTDFTWQGVVKMGAAVSGVYAIFGNASAGVVLQINAGNLRFVDYASGALIALFSDLTVVANSVHVISFRRIGTLANAWLDSTKSSVNGTVGTTQTVANWVWGNDNDTSSVDPSTMLYGDSILWNKGIVDPNVIVNQAAFKSTWNTP